MTLHKSPLFWVLLILGGWYVWASWEIRHGPGQVAPHRPAQAAIEDPVPFEHNGATIIPRALYQIEARVLSTERYYYDATAEISPIDLAVGWGPLSDERVLDHIDVSQDGRFAFLVDDGRSPISPLLFGLTHANMHMIPADEQIWKALKSLRRGHVVRLEGFLVDVEGPNIRPWTTSLVRHDTGDGACEIMFATRIAVL
jgi:hypothetical protein